MILFLTAYMKKGYGVSVVIDSLCQEYAQLGIDCAVGCLESDGFFTAARAIEIQPDFESIHALAVELECSVIVAHTTPFIEQLPGLSKHHRVWCWEHGDPNPEFFIWDRQERLDIMRRKQREIYRHLDGVIAISAYIKKQINCPQAHVVHNGCDHIAQKPTGQPRTNPRVRVGTLVRLGAGETLYKGRPILTQLYKTLSTIDTPPELHIMGRGSPEDKRDLEKMGITVHLNATDEERLDYLGDLDIFVSTSLWEGFNLPLVEAQASGTVAIAFDVGAHPETTPFITRGVDDMVSLVEHYCKHPRLLEEHSRLCEQWARDRFKWRAAAKASSRLLLGEELLATNVEN